MIMSTLAQYQLSIVAMIMSTLAQYQLSIVAMIMSTLAMAYCFYENVMGIYVAVVTYYK